MAINKGTVVTSAVTATGNQKRTVSDEIRRFNTKLTPVMSLVKTQDVSEMGNVSTSKGLIDKKGSPTMKFEWFTSTPIGIEFTATGGSATTVVIADTSTFIERDIVTNLNTLEVAIVSTLTSGTVLTVVPVGGTWSCSEGDTIILTSNAQEEGGSTAVSRTKEPDNNFNFLTEFRFPVTIANTARNSPQYAEDLVKRYKQDNMYFALRMMENELILSKKASVETTAVTIGGVALSMYTTRGLLDFSQVTWDAGGTVSYDRWNNDLYQKLPDTLDPNDELVMFHGKKIGGNMQNWVQQKYMQTEQDVDAFGVRAERFRCGRFTIKPMLSDLFNRGPLQNQAVIFRTKDIKYRFKEGLDLQVNENIQAPAMHGRTDELTGVIGLECTSGGAEVIRIINWNN